MMITIWSFNYPFRDLLVFFCWYHTGLKNDRDNFWLSNSRKEGFINHNNLYNCTIIRDKPQENLQSTQPSLNNLVKTLLDKTHNFVMYETVKSFALST